MIAEGCSILLIDGPHSPTLKKFSCSKDEEERDRWANFCSRIRVEYILAVSNLPRQRVVSSIYGNRENPTPWCLGLLISHSPEQARSHSPVEVASKRESFLPRDRREAVKKPGSIMVSN